MGRLLRIVFFPFIWINDHDYQIMMFGVKFLLAEVAIIFIYIIGGLIAWFTFGPFSDETAAHLLGWIIVIVALLAAIHVISRFLSWFRSLGQPE